MSAETIGQVGVQTREGRPGSLLAYAIYCELIKLIRIPMFIAPVLLFPTMFFLMFGLPNADAKLGGISAGAYSMASFGGYATMFVGLASFGASIAGERGLGWNRLLRVTPLNPLVYFTAKIFAAIITGLLSIVILFTVGATIAHVRMPLATWFELAGLLVLCVFPFIAIGLFIGYSTGPNSAAAISNVVFLPLAFASGLLMPLQFLPDFFRQLAHFLPSYNAAQLGWSLLGAKDDTSAAIHVAWLVGYTVVFLVLAFIAYRRDEGKNFG